MGPSSKVWLSVSACCKSPFRASTLMRTLCMPHQFGVAGFLDALVGLFDGLVEAVEPGEHSGQLAVEQERFGCHGFLEARPAQLGDRLVFMRPSTRSARSPL